MAEVQVVLHNDDGAWWAEAPDVPGFAATAASRLELRERVAEALNFFLNEPVDVVFTDPTAPRITAGSAFLLGGSEQAVPVHQSASAARSFRWTGGQGAPVPA